MLVECQVNVKSQSELDIGGRETCVMSYMCHQFILVLSSVYVDKQVSGPPMSSSENS